MTRCMITKPVLNGTVDVDSVIESFMGDWLNSPSFFSERGFDESQLAQYPAVDIDETDEALSIVAELPGMKRDEIKVVVHEGVLTISGERLADSEKQGDRYSRREITLGAFKRAFTLPKTVEVDKIAANYEQGLLRIVFPKVEAAKPRRVEVTVK